MLGQEGGCLMVSVFSKSHKENWIQRKIAQRQPSQSGAPYAVWALPQPQGHHRGVLVSNAEFQVWFQTCHTQIWIWLDSKGGMHVKFKKPCSNPSFFFQLFPGLHQFGFEETIPRLSTLNIGASAAHLPHPKGGKRSWVVAVKAQQFQACGPECGRPS